MITADQIDAALLAIRPHILKTPLFESDYLSEKVGGQVFLKLESEQYTGSFKARGSLNKIIQLSSLQKKQGIVTASTGNHALGVARALKITNTQGIIFLPENAAPAKVKALKRFPAELRFHGHDCLDTEHFAKNYAATHQKIWISPYNDPDIIAGQGTIAAELTEQCEQFDNILVTMGGGGLMSGIATYLHHHRPTVHIIGCEPANSPEMTLSIAAGRVVDFPDAPPTLSDGSAGGMESDTITFPICQKLVQECVLVEESAIADAIQLMAREHHKIIEGAAGVVIAALLKAPEKYAGQKTVLVICGSNIGMDTLRKLI